MQRERRNKNTLKYGNRKEDIEMTPILRHREREKRGRERERERGVREERERDGERGEREAEREIWWCCVQSALDGHTIHLLLLMTLWCCSLRFWLGCARVSNTIFETLHLFTPVESSSPGRGIMLVAFMD